MALMHYQGRSPINDVVRSVVLGAAMIPPLVLAGCTGGKSGTAETPPQPEASPSGSAAAPEASAPPTQVVRPRSTNGGSMPTRGFSGAGRRGGARAT